MSPAGQQSTRAHSAQSHQCTRMRAPVEQLTPTRQPGQQQAGGSRLRARVVCRACRALAKQKKGSLADGGYGGHSPVNMAEPKSQSFTTVRRSFTLRAGNGRGRGREHKQSARHAPVLCLSGAGAGWNARAERVQPRLQNLRASAPPSPCPRCPSHCWKLVNPTTHTPAHEYESPRNSQDVVGLDVRVQHAAVLEVVQRHQHLRAGRAGRA